MNKPPKERGGDRHLGCSGHVTAVFLDANRTRLPRLFTCYSNYYDNYQHQFFCFLNFSFQRNGIIRVQSLPYEIRINKTNHCIQPTPVTKFKWSDVCGQADEACLRH